MEWLMVAGWVLVVVLTAGCVLVVRRLYATEKQQEQSLVREAHLRELLAQVEQVRDTALAEGKALQQALHTSQTERRLLEQQLEATKAQQTEWEKLKEQSLEAARASVMKAGADISSKLLEDHQRETKAARELSEKRVQETTEQLFKQFTHVSASLQGIQEREQETRSMMEKVRSALLSPAGAGQLAEMTLENILKNSGLQAEQDYLLQPVIEKDAGGVLRPDAVVFLPGDHLLVIDCKASKFFLEKEEEGDKKAFEEKLRHTMQGHLKDLTSRDYQEACLQMYKNKADMRDVSRCTVLMFLPTEQAMQTLRHAAPKLEEQAWTEHIFPVGPVGLVNFLSQAHVFIRTTRQEANMQHIVEEVKKLLAGVATLQQHAEQMGKGIKSVVGKYDQFAGSFNRTFLSRTRAMKKLGIAPEKAAGYPSLSRYQLVGTDHMIETHVEEAAEEGQGEVGAEQMPRITEED